MFIEQFINWCFDWVRIVYLRLKRNWNPHSEGNFRAQSCLCEPHKRIWRGTVDKLYSAFVAVFHLLYVSVCGWRVCWCVCAKTKHRTVAVFGASEANPFCVAVYAVHHELKSKTNALDLRPHKIHSGVCTESHRHKKGRTHTLTHPLIDNIFWWNSSVFIFFDLLLSSRPTSNTNQAIRKPIANVSRRVRSGNSFVC